MPATPTKSSQKAGTFIGPRRTPLEVVLLLGVYVSLALALASGWYYFYGVPQPPPKTEDIGKLIQEARAAAAARRDAANKPEAKPFQPPPLFPPKPEPTRVRYRQIFVGDNEKLATLLTQRIKKERASFAELARKHSKHPQSAKRGGDIGEWFEMQKLSKPFAKALAKAKLKEVIGPLKTESGYYVLQLTGRREPGGVPEIWPEPTPAPKKPKQTEKAPVKKPDQEAPQKPANATGEPK